MTAWALIVGINQYPAATRLSPLFGAVADAADFADWALDPTGGGVARENMYFWTYPAVILPGDHLEQFLEEPNGWPYAGPDFARAPEARDIMECVQHIASSAVKNGATRLYIFFAGHGAQTPPKDYGEDPQNCFILGDFSAAMPAYGTVGCDDIKRFLVRHGPLELILFFDCCRVSLPVRTQRPHLSFVGLPSSGAHERLGIGHAAQEKMLAYEVPMTAPTRGAFSQLLIGGLRKHRVDGELSFRQLGKFVASGLAELVAPEVQVPDFIEKPRPPTIVLVSDNAPSGEAPLLLNFRILPTGTEFRIHDHEGNEVAHATAAVGGNEFILSIGLYSIETAAHGLLGIVHHTGPGRTNVRI